MDFVFVLRKRKPLLLATEPCNVMSLALANSCSCFAFPLIQIGIKIIHDTYLEDASLDSLANLIDERKFEKGQVIMTQGKETIASMYFVREGKVEVKSSDGKCDTCGEGTYFGDDLLTIDKQYAKADAEKSKELSVDFSSELTLDKPAKMVAKYTVTVLEDAVLGSLSIRDCRRVFDTTRIGHGEKEAKKSFTQSVIEQKMSLDDLDRHVMLGSGTFGQVWLVSLKGAKQPTAYALKIQSKAELIQAHQAKGVVQEMTIMKELQYPFLLRLVNTYQDTDFVYMLLGLVQGGELFNRIHSSVFDGVPEMTAKFYAAGVYEGLAYMHRRSIIYRDLKPENILIDNVGYPVIVDFGFGTSSPTLSFRVRIQSCCAAVFLFTNLISVWYIPVFHSQKGCR